MKRLFFILLLGLGVINAEISQRIIDFEVDTNVEISFDEGSGYWFKSNSAVCFQYDCVAN